MFLMLNDTFRQGKILNHFLISQTCPSSFIYIKDKVAKQVKIYLSEIFLEPVFLIVVPRQQKTSLTSNAYGIVFIFSRGTINSIIFSCFIPVDIRETT